MDISADLTELGRTRVAVVCAGAKSILDIGRTLEVLQTQGVPVVGYKTKEFPAFFSQRSGFQCSTKVDSPEEAACLIHTHQELGLESGVLIGVPNPNPAGEEIEQLIQTALRECQENKIAGNEVTPFILSYLHEKSKGASLEANIALIKRNAEVAAQIAVEFEKIKSVTKSPRTLEIQELKNPDEGRVSKIVVIGGAAIDFNCKSTVPLQLSTSNPGILSRSFGGVGRNIAEVASRLGSSVQFLTAVGKDALGAQLLHHCSQKCNIDVTRSRTIADVETASYISVLDESGEMKLAIAAMDILAHINDQFVLESSSTIHQSKVVVTDANITASALRQIANLCKLYSKPLFFEPVSVQKSKIVLESETIAELDLIAPNQYQLEGLVGQTIKFNEESVIKALEKYLKILSGFGFKNGTNKINDSWGFGKYRYILAKFGKEGVYLCRVSVQEGPEIIWKKEGLRNLEIKNENGAGDTLLGSLIHGYCCGLNPETAFELAFQSVGYCLESESTIPSHFPAQFLHKFKE